MSEIYVIGGVEYVEVDRKAEVGEYVTYAYKGKRDNIVRKVEYIGEDGYVVLEPLDSEEVTVDTTQASPEVEVDGRDASPSVVDLLANLARRVTSLEQQLRDTQRNVEKWAEELANNYATIEEVDYVHKLAESNEQDIAMLDERTQPKQVDVVTFDKFLDSVAEKVAQKLVGERS